MADGATNAIAFMHDGEFVYDAYQNGFDPDTRHQMWSVTKSVTTSLVGIAVGEGHGRLHPRPHREVHPGSRRHACGKAPPSRISSRWSRAPTGSMSPSTSPRS